MKLGTNDIGSVYLGTNAVQKVYLGTNEVWTSFTGLLDTYTGAAAAYSLRLLRSAYTGDAIRVRRASDNTEQDIGFVDGELDTSTLTTFCSGTNGFVKTWYDQSSNGNNATQTTASNQPQIVSSGSVILENGKPSVQFDGINDYFTTSVSATQPNTYFITHKKITHTNSYLFDGVTARQVQTDDTRIFAGVSLTNAYPNSLLNTQQTYTILFNSLSSSTFSNSNNIITGNAGNNDIQNLLIGCNNSNSNTLDGNIQEFILYPSNQSSNRTGIETNINDFYSIY